MPGMRDVAGSETRRLRLASLGLCLCFALGAVRAQPNLLGAPGPAFRQQRQPDLAMSAPRFGSLMRMRVYLKGETGSPPFASLPDFIWAGSPKKALDAYNRKGAAAR